MVAPTGMPRQMLCDACLAFTLHRLRGGGWQCAKCHHVSPDNPEEMPALIAAACVFVILPLAVVGFALAIVVALPVAALAGIGWLISTVCELAFSAAFGPRGGKRKDEDPHGLPDWAAIFGMPADSPEEAVRDRYLELVLRHDPKKVGNATELAVIDAAFANFKQERNIP